MRAPSKTPQRLGGAVLAVVVAAGFAVVFILHQKVQNSDDATGEDSLDLLAVNAAQLMNLAFSKALAG